MGMIHGRGFCTKHYQRWKKNGVPLLGFTKTGGSWLVSPSELAYIAGFMDGEGTIGIKRTSRALYRCGFSYEPYVTAGNTNPEIIRWLHDIFGGTYRVRRVSFGGNAKPLLYVWQIRSRGAVTFATWIIPYLRMKKEQAEILASDFGDTRFRGGHSTFDESHWKRMEECYQTLKKLNQRGVIPQKEEN